MTWSDPTKAGDRILAPESRELILFLPPEGKGQLLYALCKNHWPFPFRAEVQEDAILAILETIQTQNEYREVMEHLTIDGSRLRPPGPRPSPTSGPGGRARVFCTASSTERIKTYFSS
ncbi:hypothetical protein [Geoalkalibacter ferrihydriticus]|uniref:hypothetical protein n=1 Tax=Geoalkalibacter ferrihydriticus TaxID=392333 RepID=UPI0011143505|nr:hypothetical protein [Geoalkalibacter ferrihydriticus]